MEKLITGSKKQRFTIVYFDLDGFKRVNDTLGHAAGDVLLQAATSRFEKITHKDDMLGRMCGDEFVLLVVRNLNDGELRAYIEKFRDAIQMPFEILNTKVTLSASFGVTFYPDDGRKSSELLRYADNAMYSIKKFGGNGIQIYHDLVRKNTYEDTKQEAACNQAAEE